MFFSINNKYGQPVEIFREKIAYQAYWCILMYNFNTSDKILNRYLVKKYKLNLRTICFHLLSKAHINMASPSEVLVTFVDRRDDKLARLITYGTGKIPGSRILKLAFLSQ